MIYEHGTVPRADSIESCIGCEIYCVGSLLGVHEIKCALLPITEHSHKIVRRKKTARVVADLIGVPRVGELLLKTT